jgi:hypothetical protein
MKRAVAKPAWLVAALFCLPGVAGVLVHAQTPPYAATINQYCVTCHSATAKAGDLVLQGIDSSPAANPEVWEKIVRKIRSGEMPPPGRPRPDFETLRAFTTSIASQLDAAAERTPYAGRPVIRRLNRLEYGNAIRDLLAVDMPSSAELPDDGIAGGFDNIGDALSISPVLLDRYLKVARKVTDLAIGIGAAAPVTDQFIATRTQVEWQGEDMPVGSRGGISVRYYFPKDGEYALRAFLAGAPNLTAAEGVRFFQTRTLVKAGQHTLVVTFPDDFAEREGPATNLGTGGTALGGPVDPEGSAVRPALDVLLDGRRVKRFDIAGAPANELVQLPAGPPQLEYVEISGPYNPTGVGSTASRQRIFVCQPQRASQQSDCASKIASSLARRAFRRDVSSEDLRPYLTAYRDARLKGSFDESIAAVVRRVLVAPDFLFRLEFDSRAARPGTVYLLTPSELATRLSFFLWSSIPDDELLNVASSGKLVDPVVLKQQVLRMLADPRAQSLVDNFAAQWLGLRALTDAQPDEAAYPEFDEGLRQAFGTESRLFIQSVIWENRSALDLVSADYTFLNERLAKLYGIPGVVGPGFRRVSLASHPERGGLLGQSAILMMTSHTNKTSPVLRGNWILTNLLNSPPHRPPPGVPPLEQSAVGGESLTTRQLVERHRANPACASCHARMDPLGFALENFDVIGRWRTSDEGGPIDSSSKLPNGENLDGPAGLRAAILSHADDFVGGTVERLMTFALGRQLDGRDQPAIRKILRETAPGRHRFSDLILGVVNSVPFRMRQQQEPS